MALLWGLGRNSCHSHAPGRFKDGGQSGVRENMLRRSYSGCGQQGGQLHIGMRHALEPSLAHRRTIPHLHDPSSYQAKAHSYLLSFPLLYLLKEKRSCNQAAYLLKQKRKVKFTCSNHLLVLVSPSVVRLHIMEEGNQFEFPLPTWPNPNPSQHDTHSPIIF